MASYTENLNLLKKDPTADASDTFNIKTMLNENWDKLDANAAGVAAELAGKVNFAGAVLQTGAVKDWAVQATSDRTLAADLNVTGTPYAAYWLLALDTANNNAGWRKLVATNVLTGDQQYCIYNAGAWTGWKQIPTATPPDEYDLPLAAGFVEYMSVAKYWKNQFSEVCFSLSVKKGGAANDIPNASQLFTLPEGYRPSHYIIMPCTEGHAGSSEAGFIRIGPDGIAAMYNHSTAACMFVSSAGSFVAAI